MFSRRLILLMIFVRIYYDFSGCWTSENANLYNEKHPMPTQGRCPKCGFGGKPIRPGVDRVSILFILLCDFEKLFVANLRVNLCRLFELLKFLYDDHIM